MNYYKFNRVEMPDFIETDDNVEEFVYVGANRNVGLYMAKEDEGLGYPVQPVKTYSKEEVQVLETQMKKAGKL